MPGSGSTANLTLTTIQSMDWNELDALFGSRAIARGERYHEQGRVGDLRRTKDHRFVATVRGSQMGSKRAADWSSMLSRLREQHARKRSFISALDRLTRSPLEVVRHRRSERM